MAETGTYCKSKGGNEDDALSCERIYILHRLGCAYLAKLAAVSLHRCTASSLQLI